MKLTEKKEAPQWVQDVQKKVIERRQAIHKEKFDSLAAVYNAKLNELINLYFMNLTDDAEETAVTYDVLNKEWRGIVYKTNSTQKVIQLMPDGFEKNIADILNSDEYKAKLKEKQLAFETSVPGDSAVHEGVSQSAPEVTEKIVYPEITPDDAKASII